MTRLSNIDLIKHFNAGAIHGASFTNNLRIEDDKLYNYNTVIAIRVEPKEGTKEYYKPNNYSIVLNNSKYSVTTSKIQTYIRRYANVVEELNFKDFKSLYL